MINIIGYGYVGSSIGNLCEKNDLQFNVYDLVEKQGEFTFFNQLNELVSSSEQSNTQNFYLICLPTPSDSEGNCDTSIIENVLNQLNEVISKESFVIIKSTIVPGTADKLNQQFPLLNIIFCPEFLREKSHLEDMYNAKFVLLGTNKDFNLIQSQKILQLFRLLYIHNRNIDIYIRSYEEAELFKYTINNFLAVKVWYFNKIFDISESLNIDYQNFKQLFKLEPRLGNSHYNVPGDHGRGYHGNCLVKDQLGLIKLLENLELDTTVLKSISIENIEMSKNN